jgi:peroxiredoxin
MKLLNYVFSGFVLFLVCGILCFSSSCKKKDKKHDFTYDYQQDTVKTGDTINLATNKSPGSKSSQKPNPYYSPQFVEINGYVRNGGGANVAFDAIGIGEILPIQSIIIDDNGSFKLQTVIPEPGLYQLRFTNGMIHMYLRGGIVNIKTDISNLSGYQITGSPESMQLKDMYNLLNIYNDQVDHIQHRIDDLAKDKTRTRELIRLIDSQDIYYAKIGANKAKDLMKFISKLDTSAVALLASFYLEPFDNARFIKGILQKFSKICPHSKPYIQLDEKMKKVTPTGIGDYAPDMTIDNIFGKPISLNSLRGKYVLIYFWSSSEQHCRDLNPKLKTIYDNYRQKGFEVYAVALDESKTEWQKAIDEDHLGWINVSNLFGMNDEISQNIYRVTKLPHTLLIDKQGKIVAKELTPETLVSWLQKM